MKSLSEGGQPKPFVELGSKGEKKKKRTGRPFDEQTPAGQRGGEGSGSGKNKRVIEGEAVAIWLGETAKLCLSVRQGHPEPKSASSKGPKKERQGLTRLDQSKKATGASAGKEGGETLERFVGSAKKKQVKNSG